MASNQHIGSANSVFNGKDYLLNAQSLTAAELFWEVAQGDGSKVVLTRVASDLVQYGGGTTGGGTTGGGTTGGGTTGGGGSAATPEPGTLLLLGTGLSGVVGYARRKMKKL